MSFQKLFCLLISVLNTSNTKPIKEQHETSHMIIQWLIALHKHAWIQQLYIFSSFSTFPAAPTLFFFPSFNSSEKLTTERKKKLEVLSTFQTFWGAALVSLSPPHTARSSRAEKRRRLCGLKILLSYRLHCINQNFGAFKM